MRNVRRTALLPLLNLSILFFVSFIPNLVLRQFNHAFCHINERLIVYCVFFLSALSITNDVSFLKGDICRTRCFWSNRLISEDRQGVGKQHLKKIPDKKYFVKFKMLYECRPIKDLQFQNKDQCVRCSYDWKFSGEW